MPYYDYRCQSCGNEFEKKQKISDRSKPECPECGGETERFFPQGKGTILPIFKGDGFQPVASTKLSRRRRSNK